MVDLLDKFLDLITFFLLWRANFMKWLWQRIGGGKERKMNGESTTANQVRDGGKG
jgi:hypothetical protein